MSFKLSQIGKRKKKQSDQKKLQIISSKTPFQYGEAYRTLRTNINFMGADKKYQKIVITSSIPGEGKSNVAVNLSATLAQNNQKVLLIDCDLRKPVLHKYLRIAHNKKGLTNVLSGDIALTDVIVHFTDLNFDVIPAGVIPPNPAELLGSSKMETVLESLSAQYDYIIMDAPPALLVTDAAVLSNVADGVLFVVSYDNVTVETARKAKRNMEAANANVIGAVCNEFKEKGTAGYAEYYNSDYKY